LGKSTEEDTARATELVNELAAQQKVLARAQARRTELMMEFSDLRSRCDRQAIAEAQAHGVDPRFRAGEFGAMEIGLAVRESKFTIQKVLGMARRLRAEAPDSWDAWLAGDINQDKAIRISTGRCGCWSGTSRNDCSTILSSMSRSAKLRNCWAGG
jgi:hypothetical protein